MDIATESDLRAVLVDPATLGRRVLVFAPHPDDEVFGCGATLGLLAASGAKVSVIIVSDGAQGGDDAGLIETREAESCAAAKILGYPKPIFWRLPDRGVRYDEALVARMLAAISEENADLIFAPAITEIHPDHQAVALAAAEALRRHGAGLQIALYEISAPLFPNRLVDISQSEPRKLDAMRCFRSQLLEQPYAERIAALNRYRAYHLGTTVMAAEAFVVTDASGLTSGFSRFFESAISRRHELGLAEIGSDIPLVSVIVRSMNRPTLVEALDSLALQTYSNLEVVVVNAKGGLHDPLSGHCGRFPLRIVNQGGTPLSRPKAANVGFDEVRGSWLIFLDDDDQIDPDHIGRLVQGAIRTPNHSVVYTGVRLVDSTGVFLRELDEPFDRVRLWQANYLPIHAVLFSRTLIDQGVRFDESFDVYEDWDFWNQLAGQTPFAHVDGVSATYRLTGNSGLSNDRDAERTKLGRERFYAKWRNQMPAAELSNALARAEEARALTARLDESFQTQQSMEVAYRTLESGYRAQEMDSARLRTGFQALEKSYSSLEVSHRLLERDAEALKTRQRTLDENYRKLEEENNSLGLAYRDLNANYTALEANHGALEADLAALRLAFGTLGADNSRLEADKSQLEADKSQLESEKSQLEADKSHLEAEMSSLGANKSRLEAEIETQRTAFAGLETTYRSLEHAYLTLLSSTSWRLTAPLRRLRTALTRRSLRGLSISACRAVYRALPVSQETRMGLRYKVMQTPLGYFLGLSQVQPEAATANLDSPVPPSDKETVRNNAELELTAFLDSTSTLALPVSEHPRVSVLLVLFNQAGLTLGCLKSLSDISNVDFETIIVDNASTDRTRALLSRVTGATVIHSADNEGFLLAVNRAAGESRGDFLLLLNNDAVVLPGSLLAAVARMDSTPEAGAVGGPIHLWDGKLQEASSIIWRDGSCLGYGRGDDPTAPTYDFVRHVDYCSGAFLLLRRTLFEALGRFDVDYAPAYYEESDFCVRLWEQGHPVIYDPAARIRHFEFASAGPRSDQAIALQARNRERFAAKHPAFLSGPYEASPAAILFARQRLAKGKQRILFIDDRAPCPDLGGGFPRAREFVTALAMAGHFVTHYPLQFPHDPKEKARAALPDTVEIMHGYGVVGLKGFLAERRGYYDRMIVSRPHNMIAINTIYAEHPEWFAGTTIVYDAEALFSLRDIAKAAVFGDEIAPNAQEKMIRDELEIARHAGRIVTVSQAEAAHYRRHGQALVHVLGHSQHLRKTGPDFGDRHGYLFVGAIQADDSPNGDSLIWFLREVWPIIETHGNSHLDVVGLCESPEVRRLATSNVRLHGQVESVIPFYDAARVFIVPTRFAAGIPHKAHEAAAHGIPMVVAPLIATQLGWDDEVGIGSEASAFAEGCITLHSDAALWTAKRKAAWAAIERDCSPASFHGVVAQIVAT